MLADAFAVRARRSPAFASRAAIGFAEVMGEARHQEALESTYGLAVAADLFKEQRSAP